MQTVDLIRPFPVLCRLCRLKLKHQIILSHHDPWKVLYGCHSLTPHLQAGVPSRIEVGEREASGFRLPGNGCSILRIEVRPRRVLFTWQVGAFGDRQVGVSRQQHDILANARVRAVGDDLAIEVEAIAHTGRGVHQKAAVQGKGQLVGPGESSRTSTGKVSLFQGDGEGLVDDSTQNLLRALLAEDDQAFEVELAEDVQPLDVVQVEVA